MIAKFAHIGTKELPVPNGRLRDELETRESHTLHSLNSRPPLGFGELHILLYASFVSVALFAFWGFEPFSLISSF